MRTEAPGTSAGAAVPDRHAPASAHVSDRELAALEAACNQPTPSETVTALRRAITACRILRDAGSDHAARYRTLLDAVPDAVTLHDEDGRIVDANAAAAAIYGYTPAQLRQMDLRDLNPDLPERHMQEILRTRHAGRPFVVETMNCRADGNRFPVEVHSNIFKDGDRWLVIAVARDISARVAAADELRAAADHLKRQAAIDTLTGLPNRDSMLDSIGEAVRRAEPGHGPAVLYVDLDRFKVLNDMLGHAAGDTLLHAAARRLQECAADIARVARFGNDEFVLLLEHTSDPRTARLLAGRITHAFANTFRHAGEDFALTVSIGIARYPEHGTDARQLVHHADAAMFDAKRRGRNTWQAFDQHLSRDLGQRLQIESQLRLALDNRELRLEYQPQVSLHDQGILGMEALLRWRNRVLGEMRPDAFIEHAENSGEIVRIGAWVLHEACRQLRVWLDAGLQIPRMSVNVSFRQLLSGTLCHHVECALREFALPGRALELEMTERMLIDDAPEVLETFAQLRRMGVRLTIDDFGEGYSSLNYLRRLPIDGIKISHTFMQGIPAHATDSAICEAVVQIARSLGLDVIAEGVETRAQRDFLLRLCTPSAQGYLFSPPLPAADVEAFVQAWPPHP